jgi:hypothetical protein
MSQNPAPNILDHVTGDTFTVTSTQDLMIYERPEDRATVTLEVGPTQWKVLCASPPPATERGWRGSLLVISSPEYERRAFDERFRRLQDALDEARTYCEKFLRTFEEETAVVRAYGGEGVEWQMREVLDRLWRLKVVAVEREKKREVERWVEEKAARESAGDTWIEEEEPDLTFVSATVVLLHDLADAACALPCHSTELGNEVRGVTEACKQLQGEWKDFRKYVREARKGEEGMKLLCKHIVSLHEALGYHAAWWDRPEWLPKEWIDEVSLTTLEDPGKDTEARRHFEKIRTRHMTGFGMMWGFRTGYEG